MSTEGSGAMHTVLQQGHRQRGQRHAGQEPGLSLPSDAFSLCLVGFYTFKLRLSLRFLLRPTWANSWSLPDLAPLTQEPLQVRAA